MGDLQEANPSLLPRPWLTPGTTLGEGPLWHAPSERLFFIDIGKSEIHSVNITASAPYDEVTKLPEPATVIAEIKDRPDELMLGTKSGFALFNWQKKSFVPMVQIWNDNVIANRMRLNDGAVDPLGRFWAGSMVDIYGKHVSDQGSWYRLDSDLSLHTTIPNWTIPNGIDWSPDGMTLYLTDSHIKTIFAFDFDLSAGTVCNKRALYVHRGLGTPDGLTVDENGDLWVALWEGYAIIKISAADGRVLSIVRLPVSRVTCPCFGGETMRDLFVTTAATDETVPTEVGGLEGSVFRLDVGVRGLKRNAFILKR